MNNSSISKTPLLLIICLFFLWALTSNLLPILIPHFKKAFHLQYFKASLVDWAYWISYFVFAITSGMLMKKYGYKVTIIAGLLLAATGAFLFPLAADVRSYTFFLMALFIVASGMTFLETAANPYIREFGTSESYPQRLNFAQAFNGLGAVVATNFLSHLILADNLVKSDDEIAALSATVSQDYFNQIFNSVKLPYIIIGVVLLIFAVLFVLVKLPASKSANNNKLHFFNPLKYPRFSRSMVAQFLYVGAQVCVSSFFISYALHAGFELKEAKIMLGGLLICFMIGRYAGAYLMKKIEPLKLLRIYAGSSVLLSIVVVSAGGLPGIISFFGIEFFMSIMFPTIFSVGLKGLQEKTEIASSYMVMMIVGGALVPMLLGTVADEFSIQWGYAIPLICFLLIYLYAVKEQQIRKLEMTLTKDEVERADLA